MGALLLVAVQGQRCVTLAFDYPANELTNVGFSVQRSTNLCITNWDEVVTITVQVWCPTNSFFRVQAVRVAQADQAARSDLSAPALPKAGKLK